MLFSLFSEPMTFLFFVVALLVAITVHEFAHAWAGVMQGDPTAKLMGRLTLNPLVHLDFLGILMIFLVGFGWGKPVPYDPRHVRDGRTSEAVIALAGPLSNIITAFIFALPARIYLATTGVLPEGLIFQFFATVATLNIILAAFNLLPIPPLDGSKILYLVISKFTSRPLDLRHFEQIGPFLILSLVVLGRLFGVSIVWRLIEPLVAAIQWLVGATFF